MSGEKRKCQSITIHTKAKILHRHLYETPKLVILGKSTIWLTAPFPHGKRTRKKSSRKLLRSVRIEREKVNPHIYRWN